MTLLKQIKKMSDITFFYNFSDQQQRNSLQRFVINSEN